MAAKPPPNTLPTNKRKPRAKPKTKGQAVAELKIKQENRRTGSTKANPYNITKAEYRAAVAAEKGRKPKKAKGRTKAGGRLGSINPPKKSAPLRAAKKR